MLVGAIGHYFWNLHFPDFRFSHHVGFGPTRTWRRNRRGAWSAVARTRLKAGDLFTELQSVLPPSDFGLLRGHPDATREGVYDRCPARDSRTGAVSGMGGVLTIPRHPRPAILTLPTSRGRNIGGSDLDSGTDDPADESTSELAGPESNPANSLCGYPEALPSVLLDFTVGFSHSALLHDRTWAGQAEVSGGGTILAEVRPSTIDI